MTERLHPEHAAYCRMVLRRGSRSFDAAARFLPHAIREASAVFYAFCRVADDAVDESPTPAEALRSLHGMLDRVFAGTPRSQPVEQALCWLVHTHRLPRAPFSYLLEGFLWDTEGRAYQSLSDVLAYGVRVAGTVGVVMTALLGRRRAEILARACDLGVAMQLTNIARDVGEDARRGRVYLPAQWLREAGVTRGQLSRSPTHSPALATVVARLLAEAEPLYERADEGITQLPRPYRPAIRAARLMYADIGRVVAAHGYDSVTHRAATGGARKAWLALRALGALGWRGRSSGASALPEARALVEATAA